MPIPGENRLRSMPPSDSLLLSLHGSASSWSGFSLLNFEENSKCFFPPPLINEWFWGRGAGFESKA